MGKNAIERGAALLAALDAGYARSPDRKVERVVQEALDLEVTVERLGKALLGGTRIDKKLLGSLGDQRELLQTMAL